MTSHNRRDPVVELENSSSPSTSSSGRIRVGEVAGVTMMECAAVCCCCPCSLVSLFVFALYRLPTGLCQKASRILRRRKRINSCNLCPPMTKINDVGLVNEIDGDVTELEKEMWDWFNSAGFWRSASQRTKLNNSIDNTS